MTQTRLGSIDEMRRALFLLALVIAGAVCAGLFIPTVALSAGSRSLSETQLTGELRAIESSAPYACYLDARTYVESQGAAEAPASTGATGSTWSIGLAAEWSDIEVTNLVLEDDAAAHDPGAFAPSQLARARQSLAQAIGVIDEEAASRGASSDLSFPCATLAQGPVAIGLATLQSLPGWFAASLVRAQAAALALSHRVALLPTSGPGLTAWYAAHQSEFDTICMGQVWTTSSQTATDVATKVDHGLPVLTAARRYTLSGAPTTAQCFSPSSDAYTTISHYLDGVAIGKATVVEQEGSTEIYFVVLSPTSRTPNSLASIDKAVVSAVTTVNEGREQALATELQLTARVAVSPILGTWTPSSSGGSVVPPATPPSSDVLNPAADQAS